MLLNRPDAVSRQVVVLGVIGHDVHVVANRILAIGLAENGYLPHNLGTDNELDDFVDATLETGASAVLIASINGEGEYSCREAGARFTAAGLADVLRYAGGNLVVGDRPTGEVEAVFTSYGFHRVFHRPASFAPVFDALREDLAHGQP